MVPPKSGVLPEYQASIVVPFVLIFLTRSRSVSTTLPSRITCDQASVRPRASASCRSGAWAASTSMASSR